MDYAWPQLDELSPACICYTSGTTGDPKGVVYSHRSTVLHAMASCQPNALNLSLDTVVLPVVPMYHVCAWGVPYCALMSGATLVLPGDGTDGAALHALINYSAADLLLGVPTVWLGLMAHLDSKGLAIPSVNTVAVGGAAAPEALVKALAARDIYLMPLWGMTETSPLASFGRQTAAVKAMASEQQLAIQTSAGRNIWGVEMQVCNDKGQVLPRDGIQSGALQVRGHWVTAGYVGDAERLPAGQWFDTGDVATLDADGYLRIVDRKKDVIKSGGEWISSIALENAALAHPSVQEACVVGIAHPKWDERPLLLVVLAQGYALDKQSIRHLLATKMASWWLPDDIVSVDSLPHTATGKLQKHVLRTQFAAHYANAEQGNGAGGQREGRRNSRPVREP
jgi:fatty-acyl-CoA synthase